MKRINRALAAGTVAVGVVALLGSMSPVALAGIPLPGIVSTVPASTTPDLVSTRSISHPAAYAITQSTDGSTMYVGGQFAAIADPGSGGTLARTSIAAFSARTGQVSRTFTPTVNGNVWAIRAVGSSVYVAGEFTTVNGITRRGLVKLDASTGAVDQSFKPPWRSGTAYDLQVTGGRVVVGGTFAGALLALNPTTGADTGFLRLGITGTEKSGEPTHVYRFAVSLDGRRLVAIGNFLHPHARALMVDMTTGRLASWYYAHLADSCQSSEFVPAHLRDVDFSPDGSYFVIVATGYVPRAGYVGIDVCDAAARFETGIANPSRPTWINYTGGDTLHSVTVSTNAVYVQGHERWLDNPQGADTCRTTCVSRPGIGAIDPKSGRALSWNPTKGRAVGGKDLLLTSQGLWVMSDSQLIDHRYHYGIALLPQPR